MRNQQRRIVFISAVCQTEGGSGRPPEQAFDVSRFGLRRGLERGGAGKLLPRFTRAVWKQAPLLFFLPLIIAVSCRTLPYLADPLTEEGSGVIPLEPGALIYVLADVPNARPLLELLPVEGMDDKQTRQILDHTQSAVVGLYPAESGRLFQLAAWGSFPSGRTGLALGMNKDWKKRKSGAGYSYWYSPVSRLSLSVGARQTYAAMSRNGTPVDPLGGGLECPEDFLEFRRASALACWVVTPDPLLKRLFGTLLTEEIGLPLDKAFVGFFPVESGGAEPRYEVLIRLETFDTRQARLVFGMLSMGYLMSDGQARTDSGRNPAALFLANAPILDGGKIIIKTSPLSAEEISLLFKYFSI